MQNYSIGLSGLSATYAALDAVGNNIANASTEGYHRQRVDFAPADPVQSAGLSIGGGVEVAGLTRIVDGLLESEIARQESSYGQVSQELSMLSSVETSFGEFGDAGGLNETIDEFFDALEGLATYPRDNVWCNATVSAAESMASEFRQLGTSLAQMENQIVLEAQNTADSINQLVEQIAEVNGKVQAIEINGGQANNLRDRRDQLIVELSQFARVETQERDYGVVDVSIAGLPVVTGTIPVGVEVRLDGDDHLAVYAAGSNGSSLQVEGGRIGGLLALKNDVLADLQSELDTLAQGLMSQVNQHHVQGVGMDGSFGGLSGWLMGSDDLSEAQMPITDGTFYVRVTNTNTGEVERHAIDVDLSATPPDTLTSVAGKIDAISGLNASVAASQLRMVADSGYTFDFTPAVLPEPTVSNLTAASAPTVSVGGIYNQDVNGTLTFTAVGTGSVGNGNLRLNVTDQAGAVVASLNVGSGYAAGDTIEMSNGLKIALNVGDLNDGDSFQVDVLATTDTSGFLAAAGLNTFFSGTGASDMMVCRRIADHPDRIATAVGAGQSDNIAALRLAGIQDESVESLDGLTPNEYYQRIVAGVGQDVALRKSQQANIEAMMANLSQQRSEISGVNINDEAALLLVFEKTFQAVAKYLNSLQNAMVTLMDIV